MITIPSLNDVTDIADSDVVMITNSQGESFKLAGSEINKRGKIIIASGTTVTGAPLKTGSSVRIYFTADLTAANASTTLQLNYNGVNYYVKAPKNGALVNFVATNLGGTPTVYKYLQAYTTLELLFDGTQFVIIGNPVILSSADYTIYADGSKNLKYCGEISTTPKVVGEWNNGKKIYRKLRTYDYTAGNELIFMIYNAIPQSATIVGIKIFCSPFYSGNNRFQFFGGGEVEGYEMQYCLIGSGIWVSLGTSYQSSSITLNVIIDYIEN